jgi:competence protein ComEC
MPTASIETPDFPPRYQPLVVLAGAMATGILADRRLPIALAAWAVAGVVAWFLWYGLRRRDHDRTACIALLLAVASAAGAWHHLRWNYFPQDDLSACATEEFAPALIEAIAREAPRRVAAPPPDPMNAIPRGERTRLEIDAVALRDGKRWRPVSGQALLTVDGILTSVEAGDRLRITGAFALPPPPLNPGTFNYQEYLRAERIRTVVFAEHPDSIQVLPLESGISPRRWLGRIRALGQQDLDRHLSLHGARLAGALLLNAREQLETSRTDAFLETGTIHHLAISGTHVGVLAAALFLVLRLGFLPRALALLLIALIVTIYAMVTGGEPPVTRAMVLVLIVCLALYLGRQPLGFNSLGAAAIVALVWNPAELFDVGAQLSFLSVAVLIHLARHWTHDTPVDPLDRLIQETRPWPSRFLRASGITLWRITQVSFAVWLVTMPLIMARFHLISPISVALNPLLWLPVAVALLSGFAVLVLGWIPPIGWLAGGICDRSLALTESCVDALNKLPGGHSYVPGPSDWWLAGFYAFCASVALFPAFWPSSRRLSFLAAWTIAGLAPSLWESSHERPLRCHFFAVGHGSAVLIELPDGRNILYDAGQLGLPSAAARTIADALWWHGVTHLDAVVISHADVDHYCALPHLLERFSVARFYVSPTMFARNVDAVRALDEALTTYEIPRQVIDSRDAFDLGPDVRIEVLHPTQQGIEGSDNANSLVLAVTYQGRRILLTGDLEPPGLEAVLSELPLDSDVLMAPHHGSGGSDPPGLIDWSTPEWVIISGSRRDVSPTVTAAYASRGAQVLHTALDGAITVTIDDGGLTVMPFRSR